MKMKRVLPIVMAAVMMAVNIPLMASATDTAQDTSASEEQTGSTTDDTQSQGTDEASQPAEPADGTAQTGDTQTEGTAEDGTSATGQTQEETDQKDEDQDETGEEQSEEVIEGDEAETDNVVTLGENLSEAQRESMYSYFGTSAEKVRTIIVTHEDEVEYMEGIASEEQIGATTNSCAYVEPTESGGIKVKTANLNYVTSAMIASTLTTAGMTNCNVIAACPFEVSGTGALTGIIMAYETASGDNLDEGQKEAAMEELITTGELSDALGTETATELMNEAKTEILDKGLTDPEEIGEAVDEIAEDYGVTLTDEQKEQVVSLLEQISQYDYDLDAIKDTLDSLNGKVGTLESAWNSIKSFFVGSDDGILSETNDDALGADVVTDSTVDESGFKEGLLTRIINLFKKDE